MWHAKTTPLSIEYDAESRGQLDLRVRRRLEGFQLDVQAGIPLGFTALLGISGAGKSLTLRSLTGLLHPDEGVITLDGRVLFDSQRRIFLPPQERRIGYVPQHSALFPHQTVVEQIRFALPARMRDSATRMTRKAQEAHIAELVAVLELEGLERRYPDTLSGGQQRRVALARALAADPQLLVLDEPFSALDVPVRERLYEVLRHLHQQFALPVILVTHDRAEVEQLADTVVVLHQGSVVQVGNVQEVFLAPRTPEVARLVGQDNLFGGKPATPPSTQEGAPPTAIRLEWLQYAKAGANVFTPMREGECAWLPLPSTQMEQEPRQISGCIHADEIIVSRWPDQGYPPLWTPEGAVQWQATLLRVQRLGLSLRLHFHPHWTPVSGIIEVYLNQQQWREIAGAAGEVFLLKIAPAALHCFP
jgi:ABC-type sulfate/molybdate transport systems ATPase subunit